MPSQTVGRFPPGGAATADQHFLTDTATWLTWDGVSWRTPLAGQLLGGSVITPTSDATVGLRINAYSSTQTSNLFEVRDFAGNINFSVLPYQPDNPTASQNTIFIRGQMPAVMNGGPPPVDAYVFHVRGFGQGSSAVAGQHIMRVHFANASDPPYFTNYSGNLPTSAGNFQNDSVGTAATPISGGSNEQMNAQNAVMMYSSGLGTGWNIGGIARAENGPVNIGLLGFTTNTAASSSATNIGVMGIASNTLGGTRIAGYFGATTSEPTNLKNAILQVDSYTSGAYCAVFLVSGTIKTCIDNNGAVSGAIPSSSGNGLAGGVLTLIGPDGTASTANGTAGGAGGGNTLTTGAGGTAIVQGNTNQTGGAGGTWSLTTGVGGSATIGGTGGTGTYIGGAGGNVTISLGNGGGATGSVGPPAQNTGGAGGSFSVTAGNGGAASNGTLNTGGLAGTITLTGGNGGLARTGGNVGLVGGNGAATGATALGGTAYLTAGNSSATAGGANGGAVVLTGGTASGGTNGGGNVTLIPGAPASTGTPGIVNISQTHTLAGAVTDSFCGGLRLSPTYGAGAFTVTRLNYIDLVSAVLGSATVTDACVFRFDAAPGTHKALAADASVAVTFTALGPTGAQTTIQGWMKINVNGTIRYVPFW